MRKKVKLVIEIDNLDPAEAIAIEHLLATWEWLGSVGSSRYTTFYADGDGPFHPKVLVNGKKPEFFKLISERQKQNRNAITLGGEAELYTIDPDWIWLEENKYTRKD